MASKKTAKSNKSAAPVRTLPSRAAGKPGAPSPSAKKSAPVVAKKSAPVVAKKSAPVVAKKSAPVVAKKSLKVVEKVTNIAEKVTRIAKKLAGMASAASTQDVTTQAPKAEGDRLSRLEVGDSAPGFVMQDETGSVVSSDSLRGSPYVLYFYPKDDTPGCTLEACGFRDSLPRFSAKGVRVLGVSPDLPAAHARFKEKYGLTFSLLSDPEKTLAKAYGVWVSKQNYGREYMGVERSTFSVDRRGVIRQVWRSVRVPGHVDAVLHAV